MTTLVKRLSKYLLRGHPRTSAIPAASKPPIFPAYICNTSDQYAIAKDKFFAKWQDKTSYLGPWDKHTCASLNNYIISLIKLRDYDEAEKQCRLSLAAMDVEGLRGSPQHLCMQCNLAACLFLSGQPASVEEADDLFQHIKGLQNFVQYDPAKSFFEVLSMTRLMRTDCLVLRDSGDGLPDLIRVDEFLTTSSTARESTLPNVMNETSANKTSTDITATGEYISGYRNTLRRLSSLFRLSSLSLRRIPDRSSRSRTPLSKSPVLQSAVIDEDEDEDDNNDNLTRRTPSLPRLGSPDRRQDEAAEISAQGPFRTRSHSLLALTPPRTPPINAMRRHDVAVSTLTPVDETEKVADWLLHQTSNPPMPDQPPQSPVDQSIYLTTRSTDTNRTARTSQMIDTKVQNLLAVTAWAEGRSIDLHLGLDSLAQENCVSDEFVAAIDAVVNTSKVKPLVGADGHPLVVLGHTKVWFKYDGPQGISMKRVGCYVVKDLQVSMLLSERYIVHFKLRESPGIIAPILQLVPKKVKQINAQQSQAIADTAKLKENQAAAQRKAERAMLDPVKATSSTTGTASPSGGSETLAASRSSSMTGSTNSNSSSVSS